MSDLASRGAIDALLEREARLQAILSSAGTPIICTDAEFCLTEFNPAAERVFGRLRSDVLGCRYSDLLPAVVREKVDRDFARVLSGHAIPNFENVIVDESGRAVVLLWDIRCLRASDGAAIGLVAVAHDVTARHDGAELLARRTRELQILTAMHRTLAGATDPREIASTALAHLAQLMEFSAAAVYVMQPGASDPLLLLAHAGDAPATAPTTHAAEFGEGGELVLPMMAAGEQTGVLFVGFAPGQGATTVLEMEVAGAVADILATALYVAHLRTSARRE